MVPETKLLPPTLLTLPESSPFRPDPEDTPKVTSKNATKLWEEEDGEGGEGAAKDGTESNAVTSIVTVASCSRCKVQ